ncbi:MAG: twin arginine-targeting protein translocase TatB [Nitrospirae bacterium GWC2_46_6]|nr:MAG: twin arginine-targeting protein translocase TatB [Nitrospirae bacterium GWA2_46_11]OGW22210.1 MAG: twin arginine-targeting protein translocase TatB [Nitrospirae bacterium GWC2_46_6]OGW23001.1 MAG: twin arginine-targeting protein translocase TatB [Nitrospirae bacterium GWB2_47_37]HAK88343.1 twin-arginine translocase subunit TatB [Nitrospiraceae bacterium]HCL82082.1 twin-arginine translocase subunit TatB [Nitrospiraceae bacterium]
MFDLGIQELIVIFVVALLVFGPKRLPELGRTIGKGLAELKRAMHGVKEQMDAEMQEIKQPVSLEPDTSKIEQNEEAKKNDSPETGEKEQGQVNAG